MDLVAVMQEVAGRLEGLPDPAGLAPLRAFAFPPDSAPAPFAACGAPETTDFHLTYGLTGRLTLPVAVAVGRVADRASWASLAGYCASDGPSSVRQALEVPDAYTAFDTLAVAGVEFGSLIMGDVEYLAATFALDIIG